MANFEDVQSKSDGDIVVFVGMLISKNWQKQKNSQLLNWPQRRAMQPCR